MPQLSEIVYSHDVTIRSIRSYYTFLTKMYLDEDFINEPSPNGWPGITMDRYQGLGKTDEVVNLLRYLPYLCHPEKDLPASVPFGIFVDWDREGRWIDESGGEDSRIRSEDADDEGKVDESVPPSVIGLVTGEVTPPRFLLDTDRGVVHWTQMCPSDIGQATKIDSGLGFTISQVRDDLDAWSDDDWQVQAPCWSIPDFFEMLKAQFRLLNFIPITNHSVIHIWADLSLDSVGLVDALREVYKDSGWSSSANEGGAQYSKERCLTNIRRLIASSYPRRKTWRDEDN